MYTFYGSYFLILHAVQIVLFSDIEIVYTEVYYHFNLFYLLPLKLEPHHNSLKWLLCMLT